MTTRTVTFEVDTVALFDMLHKTGGDMSAIGERVVGNLLADTGVIDAIGMAVYGIVIAKPSEEQAAMQHVAYFDEGEFQWMSGIAPRDCELYAKWIGA